MRDVTASRTLVKSHPELWTECSDAGSLSRHLDRFGEIRITRLEPETAVAWEGERASGTVRLEPSGWGTRVVLTATPAPTPGGSEPEPAVEPEPVAGERALVEPEPEPVVVEPEPVPAPEPAGAQPSVGLEVVLPEAIAPVRKGFLARLRGWFAPPPPSEPESEPAPEPEPEPEPVESEPVGEVVQLEPEWVPAPEAVRVASEPEAPPSDTEAALAAALDSLGQAHHRPYSRA